MPPAAANAPETTWLFRNGVAVRERGGVEVWRRQIGPAAEQGDLFAEPPAPDHFRDATKMVPPPEPVVGEPLPAAPFAAGSATSYAAAVAIDAVAASDAERVLRCVRSGGDGGRTCQEVERLLDMAHESASARVAGLLKEGRIIRTERTRPTASGLVAVA